MFKSVVDPLELILRRGDDSIILRIYDLERIMNLKHDYNHLILENSKYILKYWLRNII
jgi:hypothetical protein